MRTEFLILSFLLQISSGFTQTNVSLPIPLPYRVGRRIVYMEGENRATFPTKVLTSEQVQNFQAIRAACKAAGRRFKDPEFNPKRTDLIGNVDLLKDAATENPKWNKQFIWKRPKDVDPEVVFSSPDPITGRRYMRYDISQGQLGDCFLLTALGLVTSNVKLTEFIFPDDNNDEEDYGVYHFRFWIRGYFFDVVVDDRLPYVDLDGNGKLQLAFTKLASGKQMWPALIEKAYAKLYGKFDYIEGGVIGEALQDLTGGLIETMILSKQQPKLEYFESNMQRGVFAGFGTPNEAIKGLQDGHAYGAIKFATVVNNKGEEIELIRLRNPWGNTEWTGDWSDDSPIWNTVPAADRDRLNIDADEGEFWMDLKDACDTRVFERVYFCYWRNNLDFKMDPINDKMTLRLIEGKWEGEGTLDVTNREGLAKRPQYKIRIKDEVAEDDKERNGSILVVSLMYKNYVERWDSIPSINFRVYRIIDESLIQKEPPFSATDFAASKMKRVDMNKDLQIARIAKTREFCTGAYVDEGVYVVVPFAEPGEEGEYLLRIISEGQFQQENRIIHIGAGPEVYLGPLKDLPKYSDLG